MTISGSQADLLAGLLVGLALTAVALLAFRTSPKLAFASWMLAVGFVPVWFALPYVVSWVPATIVGLLVLVSTYPWRMGRLGVADALVVTFFIACLLPVVVPGAWSRTSVFVAVTQWGLAFFIGRTLPWRRLDPQWMYGLVAVVMAGVAALAIIEFIFHWNPFVGLSPPWGSSQQWRGLQERGGILRAEGAFGHSIALGCSLALTVPLAMGSMFRPAQRNAVLVLLVLGAVVSFSRLGMVSALLGLVLSVIAGGQLSWRFRISALTATLVVALAVLPRVLGVLSIASAEASGSSNYRVELIGLVPSMAFFGFSPDASINASGELAFLGFRSIDSALILLGLVYGWLALGLALALLLLAVRAVLLRRAEPPTIAIAAQIPALMAVALITQYAMFFWFMAGFAVAVQMGREEARPASDESRAGEGAVGSIVK